MEEKKTGSKIAFQGFLQSEIGTPSAEESFFHIISAPLEESVSYGSGTADGPSAILAASQQLELFDGTGIPAEAGIYTHPPLPCSGGAASILASISRTVSAVLSDNRFPILLGGEHTVTIGALEAIAGRRNGAGPVGVVQFDAHADLRDQYEGNRLSHACVMRRALELGFPVFQIGVRSMSPEEARFRKDQSIGHLDAHQIARNGIPEKILPDGFPQTLYVTFDVDALDPSVMPATGTPEPGGLTWYQAMELLEKVISERVLIGFDQVELAPIPDLHFPDYTCARLIYNIMGMVSRLSIR